ncbi:hypothetical protein Droror1_Dr00009010 [Drosera rotundifolia]
MLESLLLPVERNELTFPLDLDEMINDRFRVMFQANLDQILGIKDARTAWEFLKKAHQHADEDEDESDEDDEFEDALSESQLQLRAMDRANDAKIDGNLLFKNAQYEDAFFKYELALQLAPEIPLSNELRAMCYANRGICY